MGVPDLDGQVDLDAVVKEPRLDGLEVGGGRGAGLTALLLRLDVVEEKVTEPRRFHRRQPVRANPHEAAEEGEGAETHVGGNAGSLREILPPATDVGILPTHGGPRAEARAAGHEGDSSSSW